MADRGPGRPIRNVPGQGRAPLGPPRAAPPRGPIDDRSQVSPRNADGTRRRVGPHIGNMRLTPTRVTLFVALVGSGLFLLYSFTVRDASQIPLLSSGAAVLGIVFSSLALAGVIGTIRAARDDQGGRAMLLALAGGFAALIAAFCFSAAIILALVWRQT